MGNEKEYFTDFTRKRTTDVYQSVYSDAINLFGLPIYYLPMDTYAESDVDGIWGEVINRDYSNVYGMRMISEDQANMAGGGDMFSKFGVDLTDDITLFITRKEFIERITGDDIRVIDDDDETVPDTDDTRPKISDLIYIPMWKSMFEITFVEEWENLMIGNRSWWKLICKKYKVRQRDIIDMDATGFDTTKDNELPDMTEDISTIDSVDDDGKAKYDIETDPDATGFGPISDDDITNDDGVDEASSIRDDSEDGGSDFMSDW